MQSHLEQVHGPLCMRHADVGGRFRRYVHHYATDAAVDALLGGRLLGDRDALTIIAFDDMDAFRASTSSAGYRDAVGPDEDNFREVEGSLFFFAEEAVLREGQAAAKAKLFHLRRFTDGVSPTLASQTWCERVRRLLARAGDGAAPSHYVHNRVVSGGARPAFDAIDEIGLDGGEKNLSAIGAALADAQAGLFDVDATAAMVTRPKVFVG